MKTRNGFVSNSSTSSFIITTTKDNYDKALNALHPYVKAVVECVGPSFEKLMGIDVVSLGVSQGNVSTFEYVTPNFDGDIPKEYEEKDYYGNAAYAAWEAFVEKLGKTDVITNSVDCG